MDTGARIQTLRQAGLGRDAVAAVLNLEPSEIANFSASSVEPDLEFGSDYQFFPFVAPAGATGAPSTVDIPLADGWAQRPSSSTAGIVRMGHYAEGFGALEWTAPEEGWLPWDVVYGYSSNPADWQGGLPSALVPARERKVTAWAWMLDPTDGVDRSVLVRIGQASSSGLVQIDDEAFAAEPVGQIVLYLDGLRYRILDPT